MGTGLVNPRPFGNGQVSKATASRARAVVFLVDNAARYLRDFSQC